MTGKSFGSFMEEEHLSPKSLRTLASAVVYPSGNSLLHQLVLDNSDRNASQNGSYIKLILSSMSGVYVDAVNDEGCTALHLAVMKGNLPMVMILLSSLPNIDVNKEIEMPNGRDHLKTALHLAVELHHLPMVQALLEKGANVHIPDKDHFTPLRRAVIQGQMDIVRFLVDTTRDVNKCELLLFAAETGSMETVQFLVDEKEADVNYRSGLGFTPLYLAVKWGHLSTVQFLLSRGAENRTRLHLHSSHLHVLRFLLERGVDVDLNQSFLNSVYDREMETVQFLVEEKGVDINFKDSCGYTALHTAVGRRDEILTLWLLKRGANTNLFDKREKTLLRFDTMWGHKDSITDSKTFLKRCVDRHARDSRNCGTLRYRPTCSVI